LSQARENLVRGFGPDERFGIFVVNVQVRADGLFEFAGAAMSATLDLPRGKEREEALDQDRASARPR
jgi:hypothetical protein